MKKLIFAIMLSVFILSGCSDKETISDVETSKEFIPMSEEEIKKKSHEIAAIQFKNFHDEYFIFNEEDFEYTASYSQGEDLESYFEMTYIFKPKTAIKFINVGDEIIYTEDGTSTLFGRGARHLLHRYYLLYVYNDFIVDREQGNRLDEMFVDLENQGIKYYIQGVENGETDFVKYEEFPTGINSIVTRLKEDVDKNDPSGKVMDLLGEFKFSEEVGIREKFDVTKSNHMKKYVEMMEYHPIIKIELNSENHATADLEKLNEWAKEYYNTDILQIQFTEMYNYKKDCSIDTLDNLKTCGIIHGQDFNGSFIEDFRTGKIRREVPKEDSKEVPNGYTDDFTDDPNGVIYKWNEVPK